MATCVICGRDFINGECPNKCNIVKTKEDLIVHPRHYNSHPSGIECIQVVEHYNFNIGSAIKYLWRQGLKASEPSIRDLGKAIEYIKFEIEKIKRECNGEKDCGECEKCCHKHVVFYESLPDQN
jgi:hypothetical protein